MTGHALETLVKWVLEGRENSDLHKPQLIFKITIKRRGREIQKHQKKVFSQVAEVEDRFPATIIIHFSI